MAKCTPCSSRPGTGRSRGVSAPPAMTTASNSSMSDAGLRTLRPSAAGSPALPTKVEGANSTPSASICTMRRSIWAFSSLKSGMP